MEPKTYFLNERQTTVVPKRKSRKSKVAEPPPPLDEELTFEQQFDAVGIGRSIVAIGHSLIGTRQGTNGLLAARKQLAAASAALDDLFGPRY